MITENCKKIEPVVVKLRWKQNIPLFFWTRCISGPVSTTCDGSGRLTSHWRRKQHKHLHMLLLAVVLTAATAYLLVWVVNCWTNCKSSRTLPLVLSKEPEDQSIWRLSYKIFIGYRFDSGSLSKQLFWHTTTRPSSSPSCCMHHRLGGVSPMRPINNVLKHLCDVLSGLACTPLTIQRRINWLPTWTITFLRTYSTTLSPSPCFTQISSEQNWS